MCWDGHNDTTGSIVSDDNAMIDSSRAKSVATTPAALRGKKRSTTSPNSYDSSPSSGSNGSSSGHDNKRRNLESIFAAMTQAQNRDTNALQQLFALQGTQIQNLIATQTIERMNALNAFKRSNIARK
jgi:hypothetical protein